MTIFEGPFFVAWGLYYFHLHSNFSVYNYDIVLVRGNNRFQKVLFCKIKTITKVFSYRCMKCFFLM